MLKKILLLVMVSVIYTFGANAKEVKYNINIDPTQKTVNGNTVNAFLLNGSSPGPVISADIGDTLVITVNNKTNNDLIIHWHGLLVPNNQDGVANVTQKPIYKGTSFTYKFTVKQTGTYWYHAHGLEEAQGIYGAIVLNKKGESFPNSNILLYTGELDKNPEVVLAELTKNQNATMDHSKMKHGNMKNDSGSSMKKSGMDHSSMVHFSDVTFAEHLINGTNKPITISNVIDGKVKLKIINTYVDGFLNFVYSGGDITIVSADGLDVKPVTVKNLRVAMGETYDIILDVKDAKSYELVAFLMGSNDYTKVVIGKGTLVPLKSFVPSDYPSKQPYNILETITPDYLNFDKYNSLQSHVLNLAGDHDNYNWSIKENKKIIDSLDVKVGDKVRVTITNHTMMPHPMHLHGTFFKVYMPKSNNNLIKHTFNLDPHESVDFEFIIDEQGKWLFHCHNLFHMASGMMITINAVK